MIKIDMEMPKNCSECPLLRWDSVDSSCLIAMFLKLKGVELVYKYVNKRHPKCPLKEVKE